MGCGANAGFITPIPKPFNKTVVMVRQEHLCM